MHHTLIAGDRKIVFETEASFNKLQSEDWVAPWTRYISLTQPIQIALQPLTC